MLSGAVLKLQEAGKRAHLAQLKELWWKQTDNDGHCTLCGPPILTGLCAVCGGESRLVCRGCKFSKLRYYCSKEHQLQDWKEHRSNCKMYKIVEEPGKKPCLVATRKIERETIILKATPAVIVPSCAKPVCLGCLRPLIYDVMSYLCARCGWPVCNSDCEAAPMHQLECRAMHNAGFRFDAKYLRIEWQQMVHGQLIILISLLRILLSSHLTELLKLHCRMNNKLPYTCFDDYSKTFGINAVMFIRDTLKLQQFEADIISTAFELLTCSSQLPVHRIQDSHAEQIYAYGVYSSDVAFIEHSCFPNLKLIEKVDEPSITNLVAKTDILPGDKLCAFTDELCSLKMSTFERQKIRKSCLQNYCECQRCMDPSELQLHYGSLSCTKCRGMVAPINMKNILNSNWRCNKCLSITKAKKVQKLVLNLEKMLHCAVNHENNLAHLAKFVNSHSGPSGELHAKHWLIYCAKEAYCASIFNASTEKGAAYFYDPCAQDKFFIYSNDLCSRNADLKEVVGLDFFRVRLMYSREILHQWVKKTLSREEAQGLIMDILLQLLPVFLSTNSDMVLNKMFMYTRAELLSHLERIASHV